MSTFVGRREAGAPKPAVQSEASPTVDGKAGKTRAQLVEEAESLGIEIPKKATKKQVQKLIDEAPVM